MTAPPKAQKRKKSNTQIFRFSDVSSSNSNYESSSCSEEGNIDGQRLNAQSSNKPPTPPPVTNKETENPNPNVEKSSLSFK